MTINFPGFIEEETEVVFTQIWIKEVAPKKPRKSTKLLKQEFTTAEGTLYLDQELDGAPEAWSGALQGADGSAMTEADGSGLDGTTLQACVEATNKEGLSTYGCSKDLVWDSMPPVVSNIKFLSMPNYTLTGLAEYIEPSCPDLGEGVPRLSYDDCNPIYLSHRNNFRMIVSVFDSDFKTIPMAKWTIRGAKMSKVFDGQKPKLEDFPDRTKLLDDQTGKGGSRDCTDVAKPCLGSEDNPWTFTLAGFPEDLKTPEGVQFYANLLLCDPHSNCAWTYSPPIIVDSSQGADPGYIQYETRQNTSANGVDQYLVFADSLSLNWTMVSEVHWASHIAPHPPHSLAVAADAWHHSPIPHRHPHHSPLPSRLQVPPVTKHRETYYMGYSLWHLIAATGYRELVWLGGKSVRHGFVYSADYGTAESGQVSLPVFGNDTILEKHIKGSDKVDILEKNYSLWTSPSGFPERPIYAIQHGEAYSLQMVVVTDAGAITTYDQKPVVADFTPPVCTTPRFAAMG